MLHIHVQKLYYFDDHAKTLLYFPNYILLFFEKWDDILKMFSPDCFPVYYVTILFVFTYENYYSFFMIWQQYYIDMKWMDYVVWFKSYWRGLIITMITVHCYRQPMFELVWLAMHTMPHESWITYLKTNKKFIFIYLYEIFSLWKTGKIFSACVRFDLSDITMKETSLHCFASE